MIFLAGHKVTNDPIAVPFSKGRDLICIHSKKHIKSPPEEFQRKQKQNLASMKVLSELATEGGKIFWVAPSGGRDRPKANDLTKFAVADFDPSVIEMFKYIAIVSKKVSR